MQPFSRERRLINQRNSPADTITIRELVMKRIIIIAAIALFAVAITSAGERKFEKQFTVNSGGTLTVHTDVGNVTVVGTDAREVSVLAEFHGAERDIQNYSIDAFENTNGVEVRGKGKKSSWFRMWDNMDIDLQFTIKVPREYSAVLNTSGGNITVSNVKGTLSGETSGGNITLADIEGKVTMETSGGNLQVERVTGNVQMETSGGNVRVAEVRGDLDVTTSGGNVKVAMVEGKVRAESSGGDVVVSVKNGNQGVFAETSGGDIDIVVAKNISATIDASTSGGEVSCDLPITMSGKFDEQRMRGSINGGGNTIRAHTSGGDVRIRALE